MLHQFLVTYFLFLHSSPAVGSRSCYADETDPVRRMGQKTSYFVNENLDETEISIPGCQPIHLWFLARHGTRTGQGRNNISQSWRISYLHISDLKQN